MRKWEKAGVSFLEPWRKRKEVLGAIATGSHVVGTATKYSDIDVHIILSDKVRWRERGLKVVDGFLIEYFANPIRQSKRYLEEEYRCGRKEDARMYITGKLIFDKTGDVLKLQEIGQREMKRRFRKQSRESVEDAKYHLWDDLDDLKALSDQGLPGFEYAYYVVLHKILKAYATFLGAEIWAVSKIWQFFRSSQYQANYRISSFPDKRFVKMFLGSISNPPSVRRIEALTSYVQKKMGGFRIDGWKLRTQVK